MIDNRDACQYTRKPHAPHTLLSGRYCVGIDHEDQAAAGAWGDQLARLRLERLGREVGELRAVVGDLNRQLSILMSERDSRRALAESLNRRG